MDQLTPRKKIGLYCLLIGFAAVAARPAVEAAARSVPRFVSGMLHLSLVAGTILLIFGLYRLING